MHACLLAFDTSTEAMAVALQAPDRLLVWNGAGGAAASAQLLPRVDAMLRDAGIELRQLQAIAFGAGPGAFTGLRTACAVAQGLAFGAALPVLAVDSLMLVAEDARAWSLAAQDIDVALDARMDEVYAGRYRFDGMRWQVLRAPSLCTLPALHQMWRETPPACVAGSALKVFGEQLRCGDVLRIEVEVDRAAALMRVAQQAWRDGAAVDAADALPLYLRDKVALTTAEREAERRAKGAARAPARASA
jgi:tRNA threonylcarbamoyladenosine biosynthesis protein TsaB